jgi:AraC-like DNA-binding protein
MNNKLKDLNLTMFKANNNLDLYIQSYWQAKNILPKPTCYPIAPDGAMGLVINLGDSVEMITEKKVYNLNQGEVILLGVYTHAISILLQKNCHLIGIRFNPAGAFCFFKEYYSVLLHNNIFIKHSSLYNDLKNNLTNISDILDIYLTNLFIPDIKIVSFINILKEVEYKKGIVTIDELTYTLNISRRSLDRLFKKYTAISANIYIRIIKIKYVREQLRTFKFETLTSVGYNNGYFDQSHFIKEFKTFMFKSPKNYIKEKKNLP